MLLGIVGSEGVVGSAIKFGFELLNHEVYIHDTKLETKIEDVLDTEIIFICVPTPMRTDGSCNTFNVENVIEEIVYACDSMEIPKEKHPIIAIKSTVAIGTTERMSKIHTDFDFCFIPEFLKERSSIIDFVERQDLCVVGTCCGMVYEKVKEAHGRLPKKFVQVSPSTAEAVKYANNAFGAMLVTFANSFYELCQKYDVDYSEMKNALVNRSFIPDEYLECGNKWRGYVSPCWDKDLPALVKMCEGTNVEFFKHIIEENDKYVKMAPDGMRKSY